MSGFDLGEGWRQVAEEDIRLGDAVISYASEYGADPTWWVRVPPVPPLPTEPYTVIRTGPMRWMKCGLYVHPDGSAGNRDAWMLLAHESQTELRAIQAANLQVQCVYDAKSVREQAAEFGVEVLTEPVLGRVPVSHNGDRLRIEQTKAVLARVRAYVPDIDSTLARIGREFGVSS